MSVVAEASDATCRYYDISYLHHMTSCAPMHSSTYDEDLRWRTVWQREAMGYARDPGQIGASTDGGSQ